MQMPRLKSLDDYSLIFSDIHEDVELFKKKTLK